MIIYYDKEAIKENEIRRSVALILKASDHLQELGASTKKASQIFKKFKGVYEDYKLEERRLQWIRLDL